MNRRMLQLSAASLALAAASLGSAAQAAETLWLDNQHGSGFNGYSPSSSLLFTSGNSSTGSTTARVTGWSVGSNGVISQATLGVWDQGIGVTNGNGDNSHTIDNVGSLDFIVLQFNSVVELQMAQFYTGWHNMNDTDATVGFATMNLGNATAVNLNGFTLANLPGLTEAPSLANGNNYRDINLSNPNSRGDIWLIGASFAPADRDDGFKLEKLTFSQTAPLPEPSTWAMMLIGFGAVGGTMRMKRRRQNVSVSYA